jgi:hypothetical protein
MKKHMIFLIWTYHENGVFILRSIRMMNYGLTRQWASKRLFCAGAVESRAFLVPILLYWTMMKLILT